MIYTLQVPGNSKVDIKKIHVATVDDEKRIFAQFKIDNTYKSTYANIPFNDFETYNGALMSLALRRGANLAIYCGERMEFYRVQERKIEGRLVPGTGIGVIIKKDNKILLMNRSGTSNNRIGLWDLPGGTVEKGDTLEDTVVKEVKEETGFLVKVQGCVSIYQDMVEDQHWISYTFLGKIIEGELDLKRENYKFKSKRFFSKNKIPKNTSELTIQGIDDYLNFDGNYINIPIIK